MSAGSIVIDLMLRTGSLSTDAARAAKDLEKVKKAAYETGRQIGDSIKGIAAAVGVGLSVGAFANLIKGSIDAADHLNDLSKRTGIAVEALGGIGFAAKQAGLDLDSVAAGVGKLNKSIAAARAGDKTAKQGFDVLGIDVDAMTRAGATATDFLVELSDKFAQFEDGPEKAALAIRVFGKAGADMIPLLNDGGDALIKNIEYFQRYGGVTADLAGKSDQFNDTLEKLSLLSGAFGNTLAAALLPTMQTLADELLDAKENSSLFKDVAEGLATTFKALVVTGATVVATVKGIAREFGFLVAVVGAVSETMADSAKSLFSDGPIAAAKEYLSGSRRVSEIMKAAQEDRAKAADDLVDFNRKILNAGKSVAPETSGKVESNKKPAPRLPDIGNANAELKRQLDGRLKLIRDFAQQEQQGYQFAQKYVDQVFDDGVISLRDKFAAEKSLRDAALASEVQAIDAEIAARREAAKRFSGADRVAAENDIREAISKRAEVIQKASQEDILAAGQEAKQVQSLRDSYDDLAASVKELKGDTAGAALIRNQQAVKAARELLTQDGKDQGLADQYSDLLTQTTQLSQAQREYNILLERARVQEESLVQAAQDSGATEIETMRAVGAQRQKTLQQLGEMAAKARELADRLGTPEAVAFADQLALAFRKASAEVDPLLTKLREVTTDLGNGFGDIFGRAIEQGQGLKAIIGEIGDLVQRTLTQELIAKPLSKSIGDLLGGTGSSGGLLGSLFGIGGQGGGGVDASAAATTASFTTLQAVGIEPTIAALLQFQTALGASTATSAVGDGGGVWDSVAGFFGSFFSSSGGYDGGGYTGPGGKKQPAGIVHKGEVVFSQDDVKRAGGVSVVEGMRRGLSGYADGGVAGMSARVYSRGPWGGGSSPQASAAGKSMTNNFNFSIAGPVDRRTEQQIASAAGRGVQRAVSRNN